MCQPPPASAIPWHFLVLDPEPGTLPSTLPPAGSSSPSHAPFWGELWGLEPERAPVILPVHSKADSRQASLPPAHTPSSWARTSCHSEVQFVPLSLAPECSLCYPRGSSWTVHQFGNWPAEDTVNRGCTVPGRALPGVSGQQGGRRECHGVLG